MKPQIRIFFLVRTSVTHSAIPSCATFFCSYHILTSSVIYYWTDARSFVNQNATLKQWCTFVKCFYIYFFNFSRKWNLNCPHTYCDLGKTTQLNNPVWSVVANIPNLNCKFFLQWNICQVLLVDRALAIHVQNFNKQKSSVLLPPCYKMYQHSASNMLVDLELRRNTTKTCFKNFVSGKLRESVV